MSTKGEEETSPEPRNALAQAGLVAYNGLGSGFCVREQSREERLVAKQPVRPIVVGAPDDKGKLRIAEDVVAEIAYTEAMSTEGVEPPLEGLMQGVLRRHGAHGVRVEMTDRDVVFHMTIGIHMGKRIPEVVAQVRQRIAAAVRTKTGYAVRAINLVVDHVAFDDGLPEGT